jgi:hypothetical protein
MGVGSSETVQLLDGTPIVSKGRRLDTWLDLLTWINKLDGDESVDQADLELWDRRLEEFSHL